MINNKSDKNRRFLDTETTVLYAADADRGWSYCHHASLGFYNNCFYAMWSNGRTDEDDIGQRVLYSVSRDGRTWSDPRVLFEPSGENAVLTAAGFFNSPAGLVAYAGTYSYKTENIAGGHYVEIGREHTDTSLLCRVMRGGVWSPVIDTHLPVVPNHGPQCLSSGRLILCGNFAYPVSDCSDGINGWKMRGLEPYAYPGVFDDSAGFICQSGLRRDKKFLCEGSFIETAPGVIHMLLRSGEGILYQTVSTDEGENWNEPQATAFTDCGAKFHCGRLPDGRYYIVGNPDRGSNRNPLVLSLSENGEDFDEAFVICNKPRPIRIPGKYKGGIYGYPHSLLHGGKMYVICSVNKEDIYLFSFDWTTSFKTEG